MRKLVRNSRKTQHYGFLKASTLALVIQLSMLPQVFGAENGWQSYFANGQSKLSDHQPAQAESCFRKALALAKTQGKEGDVEKCMAKLADTLVLKNQAAEAEEIYLKLLSEASRKKGNSTQISSILMSLGSIQEAIGNHSSAMAYYHKALQMNQKNSSYSPAFAESFHGQDKFISKMTQELGDGNHSNSANRSLLADPSLVAGQKLQEATHSNSDLISADEDLNDSLLKEFHNTIVKPRKSAKKATTRQPSKEISKQSWHGGSSNNEKLIARQPHYANGN